jgi:DNA-binding transcriptional LysR family regulator
VFPTWLLLECLAEFAIERPETRIEVFETVLTGTQELLAEGRVDFAIGTDQSGLSGEPLMHMRFIAVASPDHPLHHLGRKPTVRDLRRHRRILIRDSGTQRKREVEGVELRWTVSHKATSIRAVSMGLGYAWLPEETILPELAAGTLKPLALAGGTRSAPVLLNFSDPEFPGRDAARLVDIIRARVTQACRRQKRAGRARR